MIKTANIKIEGKEYLLKRNFKSLLLFEELTGKNVFHMSENLTDSMMLQYCILKANNTIQFTFDQYLDYVDDDPKILETFTEYLTSLLEVETQTNKKKEVKK